LLLMAGCQGPQLGDGPVSVQTRELPAGVADAYRTLTGASQGLAERTRAAGRLIQIDDFEADRALAAALADRQPETVQRAVLLAVAGEPARPPRGLWRPMLSLLYQGPEPMLPDVIRALGRYRDKALLDRLMQTALDEGLPTRERSRAIAALGPWRLQGVAEHLVELTAPAQPEAVQAAAYEALAVLTGIQRFGADRGAWNVWWESAQRLSTVEWYKQLVENLAYEASVRQATDQQLAQKLREAERALYQASSPSDQAGVLVYMLDNPLTATRLLALDLAQARLVQGSEFDDALREALRARLDDASAEVRWRSAEVLRDLADAKAADKVAEKLVRGEEQVNRVLAAYLQVIAQTPRKRATDAVYDLLDEPGLKADAAAALAEIARAGQLTPRRADAVLQRLREDLEAGQRPSPSMIRLLGRIGRNDEWQRIEAWIDDPDPVIKQAAAQAWADATDRSLAILAGRADDPIIQPIVIRAATERGQDPMTLRKLAENPPTTPQFMDAWERALIAMAGQPTISPTLVLEVTQRVYDQLEDRGLVESLLTAALERRRDEGQVPGPFLRLRLARAENRLARNEPELAILDFETLLKHEPLALSTPELDRLYRGAIPAYLRVGRYEPAFDAAEAFFEDPARPGRIDPGAADDRLIQTFLDTAKRQAELGRMENARAVFGGTLDLLGRSADRRVPPRLAPQINTIREMIELDSTRAGN
jgi:hypothetical protein